MGYKVAKAIKVKIDILYLKNRIYSTRKSNFE